MHHLHQFSRIFQFISDLDIRAASLVAGGLRTSTHRTYSSAQRHYIRFCATYAFPPIPSNETQLLRYVAYCSNLGLAASTVQVYLSAISSLHTLNGLPPPPIHSPRINLSVKSILESQLPPARKAPITVGMLYRFLQALDFTFDSYLWRAVLCLGFFGALRGSEYTSPPPPLMSQLQYFSDQGSLSMTYTINRSKVTPHGFTIPLGCTSHSLCPVCTMSSYLSARSAKFGLHPDSHLFLTESGSPVSKLWLNQLIKLLASKLGLDPAQYSSHSLRAGAATSAQGRPGLQPLGDPETGSLEFGGLLDIHQTVSIPSQTFFY